MTELRDSWPLVAAGPFGREFSAADSQLQVSLSENRAVFRVLAHEWRGLAAQAGLAGPFHEPIWFALAATHLAGRGKPGGAELRLLLAHRRGRLVGALPLLWERRLLAGAPARVLRSLSDDHSQRFDAVACDSAVIVGLWKYLRDDPTWDVLELRDIPRDSCLVGRLADLAREDGFPTVAWQSQRSPYLSLPSTVEEMERRLDGKFRANLRRRKRGLATLGPVSLERIDGVGLSLQELSTILDEGWRLERSGWKGQAKTAIACDASLRSRYLTLAKTFAGRGELSLHFLRVGERRVAFHFSLESDGVYYFFKPGYDITLARHGLGHLLVWEVARSLIERGLREIDFLGDDLSWKREWTKQVREHTWHYIYRPTVWGFALHAWKTRCLPELKQVALPVLRRIGFAPVSCHAEEAT